MATYGVPIVKSRYNRLVSHKDHVDEAGFPDWAKEKTAAGHRLAVDLFTGAGGLSWGVQQAGWTMAAGIDFNAPAVETHAHNFPGMSLIEDLGNPANRDRLVEMFTQAGVTIDLIAGGPPCQPFSRAGRNKIRSLVENHGRDPEDARKELWRAYLDIVTRVRPRAVIMENVPDMGLQDDFAVVRIIEEKLESLGYSVQVKIASAWHYGVPQHRRRLILLARNDVDRFTWPSQRERVTLDEAISDLPRIQVRDTTGEWEVYRDTKVPKQVTDPDDPCTHITAPLGAVGLQVMQYQLPQDPSWFVKTMREGVAEPGKVHDHTSRRVREDDYAIFKVLTKDLNYAELAKQKLVDRSYIRYAHARDFKDKYNRLDGDDLSRTVTAHLAKDGYWYIHPHDDRTLTVREAARVQSFPDRFEFAGTRSDAYRQIGNAVPPLLGEAAALAVKWDNRYSAGQDLHPTAAGRLRQALNEWAQEESKKHDAWFSFPSEDRMRPPQAAVAAVLSGCRITDQEMAVVMTAVDGKNSISTKVFTMLDALAPTEAARGRLARLKGVGDRSATWRSYPQEDRATEVQRQTALHGFKAAEEKLYTVLRNGPDLLLNTLPSQRVAARVAGTNSDVVNRSTDGRVDLSRLVGADEHAAMRVAAVQVIGKRWCRSDVQMCGACPLQAFCATANGGGPSR